MATKKGSSLWANRKCVLICCAIATANLQYGIDTATIGSFQAMPGFLRVFGYPDPSNPIGYGIDSTVQQLITSLLTLGSFLSSLGAGFFAKYFGRRIGLWTACVLGAISCAIQLATTDPGVLYFARLLMGLSNGFLVTFSNVYVAEVSTAELRGIMVALFSWWVNIGAIIGAVVVNYTSKRLDKNSYRIPVACLYIVPIFLAVVLFFVPESPRYLLHREKTTEALRALTRLRGRVIDPMAVDQEWDELLRGVEEEKRASSSVGFFSMFKGVDRRRTLLCFATIASQTASGIWFYIAYSTYFFSVAGVTKSFHFSIMTTCMGFVGVLVGMYSMKKLLGQRSMLIIGSVASAICQLAPAISWSISPGTERSANLLIGFIAVFQFSYNAGVGAASYPVATELVSSQLRAWSVGTATSIGYILAWLTGFCSPYFVNPTEWNWGAQYGYIWAGSNIACAAFFYLFMPELKGRPLEEIDEMFKAKLGAREFSRYQDRTSGERAGHIVNGEAKESIVARTETA